jgi:hypothetical protein
MHQDQPESQPKRIRTARPRRLRFSSFHHDVKEPNHTKPTQTPRSHSGLVAPNDCTEVDKAGRPLGAALGESYIGASRPGSQAGSEKIRLSHSQSNPDSACMSSGHMGVARKFKTANGSAAGPATRSSPVQQPGPAARSSHLRHCDLAVNQTETKIPRDCRQVSDRHAQPQQGRRERRPESTGLAAD